MQCSCVSLVGKRYMNSLNQDGHSASQTDTPSGSNHTYLEMDINNREGLLTRGWGYQSRPLHIHLQHIQGLDTAELKDHPSPKAGIVAPVFNVTVHSCRNSKLEPRNRCDHIDC